jgi:hypothetical protein
VLRLNFKFSTKQGDLNCLDIMGALQGEEELLFVWGQTAAAFDRVVELCDREVPFRNAKGKGLLSRSTVCSRSTIRYLVFFL